MFTPIPPIQAYCKIMVSRCIYNYDSQNSEVSMYTHLIGLQQQSLAEEMHAIILKQSTTATQIMQIYEDGNLQLYTYKTRVKISAYIDSFLLLSRAVDPIFALIGCNGFLPLTFIQQRLLTYRCLHIYADGRPRQHINALNRDQYRQYTPINTNYRRKAITLNFNDVVLSFIAV